MGADHKSKHGRAMAANENVAQNNDANQNGGVQQQQQFVLGICLKSLNSEINRLGSHYFENGQVVLPSYIKTGEWLPQNSHPSIQIACSEASVGGRNLKAYRMDKIFKNVTVKQICTAFLNPKLRANWDTTTTEINCLEFHKNDSVDAIKSKISFSAALNVREYYITRKWQSIKKDDREIYIILLRSASDSWFEENVFEPARRQSQADAQNNASGGLFSRVINSGIKMVKDQMANTIVDFYYSVIIVEKSQKNVNDVNVIMVHCEDSKSLVPQTLIDSALTKSLPEHLDNLNRYASTIGGSKTK